MNRKYYCLIAFKPHCGFYDQGEYEIIPAKLERFDNLSKEELISKMIELSTYQPLVYGKKPDCVFEEFHFFDYTYSEIEDIHNEVNEEVAKKVLEIKNLQKKEELHKLELAKIEKNKLERENKLKMIEQLKRELNLCE